MKNPFEPRKVKTVENTPLPTSLPTVAPQPVTTPVVALIAKSPPALSAKL